MIKIYKCIVSIIIAACLLIPMLMTAVGAEGLAVERPDKDKYVNNQILFRIKEYPDENNIEKLKDEYDFIDSELVFDFDKNPDIKDRLYCATVPDEYDVVDLCSEFKKFDYVSSTYLNCYGEYTNLNDNSLLGASSKQWHMHDLNMYEAWKLCDDPATPAVNESGDGTVIAVIDTGFDFTNPALQNSFIKYNDTDENNQPVQYNCYDAHEGEYVNVNDLEFHGTAVASCIVASGSDSPVVGVAPGAKILPVSIGYGDDEDNDNDNDND
ncbi:MAG: S8/S53 family peptidase, partial [Clostridia bacterium]|nr:S8/S53 family peptidase [Clostridia bacterium]